MYTYVVLSKKTYRDLATSDNKDIYEAIRVLDNIDEANEMREQYEAYCGMLLNKIDINGILLHAETKAIALEGSYNFDQVQKLLDVAPSILWDRGRKKL